MRLAVPVAMVVSIIVLCAVLTFTDGAGAVGDPMALVFPPLWQEADVFRAASALNVPILGFGGAPFVVFVEATQATTVSSAYEVGAAVVLNATFVDLCGTPT